eukprot:CAMPEP_0182553406 /NCGR_PEP_ID=MMETSP1323-20130603/49466_1 /TAXON_ID=236787 /ORGANISM="Florenciella parvula, Strain RCC1693" /LENGTH=1365 /DNA_ID=CAMNT_0024765121 /DNA_START=47 /DNA_END=4144 /DNA_ORIENTATION=-
MAAPYAAVDTTAPDLARSRSDSGNPQDDNEGFEAEIETLETTALALVDKIDGGLAAAAETSLGDIELGELGETAGTKDGGDTDGVGDADADGKDGEKKEKKPPPPMVPLKALFRFASRSDLALTWLGLFFCLCSGAQMPAMAIIFGEMIDTFGNADEGYERDARELGLGFVILGALAFVANFCQSALLNISAIRQAPKIKAAYLHAVLRQDVSWFDTNNVGVAGRLSTDASEIQDAIGEKLGAAIQSIAQFCAGIFVGFFISWRLSLVVIAIVPPLAIALGLLMYIVGNVQEKISKASAGGVSLSQEALAAVRTVASFTLQEHITELYSVEAEAMRAGAAEIGKSANMAFGVFMCVNFSGYALALWYGSTLVEDQLMTGGQVLTVFWAIMMGGMGLATLANSIQAIIKGRAAGHHLFTVIDRIPPIDSSSTEGLKPESCTGTVELRDVHFHYPSRPDVPIFSGYSLKVEAGQTVALVGASGGGKSTVINLLERFYDPQEGDVLVDGRNVMELNVAWLRDHIGVVAQEPTLFATSIMANIIHGKKGATEAEAIAAAKMANAHDFIESFQDGYQTYVGERGIQLSGGQKQRIAIARAIIKDPQILLLDEATSALDSESEGIVQQALDDLLAAKKRTTIVVAHRLSTIRNADVIAVCYDGKIVEMGTHDELANKTLSNGTKGYYANLLSLQSMATTDEAPSVSDMLALERQSSGDGSALLNAPTLTRGASDGSTGGANGEGAAGGSEESKEGDEAAKKALADNILTVDLATVDKKKLKELSEQGIDFEIKGSMFRLWPLCRPEWHLISLGFLGSLVGGASTPSMAVLLGLMLTAFFEEDVDKMTEQANFYSLCFLFLGVVQFFACLGNWPLSMGSTAMIKRLRIKLFSTLMHQEIALHDQLPPGALSSQLSNDMGIIARAHAHAASTKMRLVGTTVGMIVICLVYSWRMTLVMAILMPIVFFAGYGSAKWWVKAKEDESTKLEGQLVAEAVSSIRTVTALQLQDMVNGLYRDSFAEPIRRQTRQTCVSSVSNGLSHLATMVSYGILFTVGSIFISQGNLTARDMFISLLTAMFSAPSLGQFSANLPDELAADVAAARIFRILDRVPAINSASPKGLKPFECRGEVELKSVDFSYPLRPTAPIFKDYSLKVGRGQTVALVGESGGGKSTVISLLSRFYDPTKGGVFIDGVDVRELNVQWLRDQIGLVAQEPVLFQTTIMENIRYGKKGATDEEIVEAAKAANAHDFVESFPDKYDTQVGAQGTQLSGGQRQRIAIARAIVKDPQILLLDEATSALDSESERIVQQTLDDLLAAKKRTTIVVAHRLSTIRNADAIAVVYNGKIVEMGTHDELSAIPGGYYANLIKLQDME